MILLIFLIFTFMITQSMTIDDCNLRQTCRECIQTVGCGWCYDVSFTGIHRCMNDSFIYESGCSNDFVFDPKVESRTTVDNTSHLFSPQRISTKLRMKQQFYLNFEYSVLDLPLDLYVLMDFSGSMKDDKDKLSNLGSSLQELMNNITSDYLIGFGGFVDKTTMPFISVKPEKLKQPCRVNDFECDPAYVFRNHLRLQDNITLFTETVGKINSSGNIDAPEGSLEALMQSIVCVEQIGWRKNSRKVVLLATDNGFHIAGDGKLGGIIIPNDGACHLDETGFYTESLTQDYPSVSQITEKVQEESVHVIFAATENIIEIYRELQTIMKGSRTEILSKDSSNIVALLREEYNAISTSVEFKDDANEPFQVSYNASGSSDCEPYIVNKYCGLKNGDVLRVQLGITVKQCNTNETLWKRSVHIKPVGIRESLTIDTETYCDCPCMEDGKINASECNYAGILKCGICYCYDNHYGSTCECNGTNPSSFEDDESVCHMNGSAEVCSGRGTCICGKCQCELRKNPREIISGEYCQCDNFSCPKNGNTICSNNGICICGKCECTAPWSGESCDCYSLSDTCVSPTTGKLCSDNGNCVCGKCICDITEQGVFTGDFCEIHPATGSRCDSLTECVNCQVSNQTSRSSCIDCNIQLHLTENAEANPEKNEVQCFILEECKRSFYYYTDESTGDLIVWASTNEICPQRANVPLISGIFLGAILLTAILALIIWKLVTNYYDNVQYAKFEESAKKARMNAVESPLYKPAVLTYRNPLYEGKSKMQ